MAKKGTVLIVDDEEIMRDVLETILSSAGYKVDLAKTGEEALEAFSRARIPGGEDGPLSYFVAKAQDRVALPESRPLRLVRELTDEGHARHIEKF